MTWLTNAGVHIQSDSGTGILCDPWVVPGAFLGSWVHSKPLDDLAERIQGLKVDAIVVSHLHTDHFDRVFLSKYLRAHPETPVIIARFAHPWLRNASRRVVAHPDRLIEATPHEWTTIGDVRIKAFPAGPCNPAVCGVSFACSVPYFMHSIDSVFLIEGDGQRIVNANDALSTHVVPTLKPNLGTCDLFLGHYGAASPYPQAFVDLSPEFKLEEKEKIVQRVTGNLARAAESLEARYVFPFAGDYLLAGRLTGLNADIASANPDVAADTLAHALTAGEAFSLDNYGQFDLTTGEKTEDFVPLTAEHRSSYEAKLAEVTFPYERDREVSLDVLRAGVLRASESVMERARHSTDLEDASYVLRMADSGVEVTLNFHSDAPASNAGLDSEPESENITTLTVPDKLIARFIDPGVVASKAFTDIHWNQADVGSHFLWQRSGAFPDRVNYMMSFFGKDLSSA